VTSLGREVWTKFNDKQRRITELMADGCTSKDIGNRLGMSEESIKKYTGIMYQRSGTDNRLHFVIWCMREGILKCPCHAKAS
jgi:DNA-binding CsgD family transcriptional regulator